MITERDKKILIWVEDNGSITINQCCKLFFKNNKMAYDQARKRLRYLNKERQLHRYRKDPKSQAVYFINKRLGEHDLKIVDVLITLQEFNVTDIGKQTEITINPVLNYIADATATINVNFHQYPILVEVDYTHYTSKEKIKNLISYLEPRHTEVSYLFLIVRQTVQQITVAPLGSRSKLILVPWGFNNTNELSSSLRSLLSPKNIE